MWHSRSKPHLLADPNPHPEFPAPQKIWWCISQQLKPIHTCSHNYLCVHCNTAWTHENVGSTIRLQVGETGSVVRRIPPAWLSCIISMAPLPPSCLSISKIYDTHEITQESDSVFWNLTIKEFSDILPIWLLWTFKNAPLSIHDMALGKT